VTLRYSTDKAAVVREARKRGMTDAQILETVCAGPKRSRRDSGSSRNGRVRSAFPSLRPSRSRSGRRCFRGPCRQERVDNLLREPPFL
jgi:hypothetical protein